MKALEKPSIKKIKRLFSSLIFPLVVIVIFLIVSIIIRDEIYAAGKSRLDTKNTVESTALLHTIAYKYEKYASLLYSTRGLFYASDSVTRQDWANFVQSLNLKKNFPSVTALIFLERVTGDEKASFEKRIESDAFIAKGGFASFSINPNTSDTEYYIANYVEPIENNESAPGFNLNSDPVRRTAIALARDTNTLVITGPITLVVEKEGQKSFLMLLPVYKSGTSNTTLDERRANIIGLVSVAVRAPSFFSEVILSAPLSNIEAVSITDVTSKPEVILPYVTAEGITGNVLDSVKTTVQTARLNLGTRIWEIDFKSDKQVEVTPLELLIPYILLFAGIIISLLERKRVLNTLKESDDQLLIEKGRLDSIIKGSDMGTWEWNVLSGSLVVNERWAGIIGYTLEELQPISIKTWENYTHPDDLVKANELLQKHFAGVLDLYEIEIRMRHKNGNWVWIADRGKVITWTADKKPLLMCGTHQDDTERKSIEAKLLASNEELERTNTYMTGRELVMIDLKKEIASLKKELEAHHK